MLYFTACLQSYGNVPVQGLLDRADAAASVRGVRHLCWTCILHVSLLACLTAPHTFSMSIQHLSIAACRCLYVL